MRARSMQKRPPPPPPPLGDTNICNLHPKGRHDEHPCQFYMGVPRGQKPSTLYFVIEGQNARDQIALHTL